MEKPYVGLVKPGQFTDYFGARLFVPRGHFAEAYLLAGGQPEPHVLGAFSKLVRAGDVVLDIGANIGTHSFALAALVGPTGRVYAVEADVDNAASLRSSIVESGAQNVLLLPVGAADRSGLIRSAVTVGTNSVFSQNEASLGNKIAVAIALDDVVKDRIDFIKLDIEGAELLALHGLARTVARSRPIVLSEFSPAYIVGTLGCDRSDEFHAFFANQEYSAFYIHPVDGMRAVEGFPALLATQKEALDTLSWNHIDVLFMPREHALMERVRN